MLGRAYGATYHEEQHGKPIQENILLRPVFLLGGRRAWAAYDRQGNELGILIQLVNGVRVLCDPANAAGNPMLLVRCRLVTGQGTRVHVISLSRPGYVSDPRPSSAIPIPEPTCAEDLFAALRRSARNLQDRTRAGQVLTLKATREGVLRGIGRSRRKHVNADDVLCALRAEGWRTAGEGWTYD